MADSPQPNASEAQQVAEGLSLLVHNTLRRHWFSSMDERESRVSFYALLSGCLTRMPEVIIRVAGDSLLINDLVPKDTNRTMETLVAQFKAQQVSNVAFRRGITLEELTRFVAVLVQPGGEGAGGGAAFQAALTEQGVAHIAFKTLLARELGEDDLVISRKALEAAGGLAAAEAPVATEAVLAYLSAGADDTSPAPVAAAAPAVADGLARLAEDTKRLAALVLQAAASRPAEDGGIAAALVSAMNRAFEVWSRIPGAGTATGKKRTQKNLRALERDVLKLLDTLPAEEHARATQAVQEVVSALEDDVHVDVLAAEYLRRLKAMEQTEQRLQRYLRARGEGTAGVTGLVERLQEGGLAPDRLRQLMPGSGVASGVPGAAAGNPGAAPGPGEALGAGGSGPGAAATDLEVMLASLQLTAAQRPEDAQAEPGDELDQLLQSVQKEIRSIMDRTADRIRYLSDAVKADEQAATELDQAAKEAGVTLRLTRKQLLEMLAEIAQELCQPLSVVQCSVDMITSRMLGAVSEPQMEMLKLVAESVQKLQSLITGLRAVAGVPDSFTPDRALIQSVERKRE